MRAAVASAPAMGMGTPCLYLSLRGQARSQYTAREGDGVACAYVLLSVSMSVKRGGSHGSRLSEATVRRRFGFFAFSTASSPGRSMPMHAVHIAARSMRWSGSVGERCAEMALIIAGVIGSRGGRAGSTPYVFLKRYTGRARFGE